MPAPTATDEIDRVDERNARIGTVKRGAALEIGANFRTVHAVLTTAQGLVVLQQLARGRVRHPRRLGSSVAGYLHARESYGTAIRRRVWEELGARPTLTNVGVIEMDDEGSRKFVGVFTGQVDGYRNRVPNHIERLVEVAHDSIDQQLTTMPAAFTPTCRHVWAAIHRK